MSELARVLFIRLDRIGDLVLTLPVDESLPNTTVDWWVPTGLKFITESAVPRRDAREVAKKTSWREFLGLWKDLRTRRYDAAVVFHAPWWVSCLLWCARIPTRGGVRSQWHSFLFLNRGVRQKRSRAEFSELEYNFRLVEEVFDKKPSSLARGALRLTSKNAAEVVGRCGLEPQRYIVIHPGMGGSALNWPIGHYADLIRQLAPKFTVAVTGTAADATFLDPLKAELQGNHGIKWLDGRLKGEELIAVLQSARAVVAPSTGVLHLAASTGTKTIGIFSPVRVQHPRRWGPQGARTLTLLPPVQNCPGEMSCLGSACANYDCMSRIGVTDLMSQLGEDSIMANGSLSS